MRKLTQEASKAMHFFRSIYPTGALRRFVLWLIKYDRLFSTRCSTCKQGMRPDEENTPEPPYVRDFRDSHSRAMFHPDCFPFSDRVY